MLEENSASMRKRCLASSGRSGSILDSGGRKRGCCASRLLQYRLSIFFPGSWHAIRKNIREAEKFIATVKEMFIDNVYK